MNLADLRRICDGLEDLRSNCSCDGLECYYEARAEFGRIFNTELVGLLLDCAEAGAAVHFGTSYHYDATCGCGTCVGMSLAQDRLDAYLKEQA